MNDREPREQEPEKQPAPWWTSASAGLAAVVASVLALAQQGLIEGLGNKLGPVPASVLLVGLVIVTASPAAVHWVVIRVRRSRADDPGKADTPRPEPGPDVPHGHAERASRTPYNLPQVDGFEGRRHDLDLIAGRQATRDGSAVPGLLSRMRVVVVAGDRGVGTSWCVRRAAHDSWDQELLPEGRVYVDLRTAPQRLDAVATMRAMARLANLGELPAADDGAQVAAGLQRLLGDRRILFVLDNVDRPEQIRPILAAHCHLLVAAGPALRGFNAATVHELRPLARDDAVDLFRKARPRRPTERRTDYEAATVEIARLFAGQPTVLHELAGWGNLRRTPADDIAEVLRRTLDAPVYTSVERLDAIDAACEHHVAYASLSPPAQRLARLLSIVSGFLTPEALRALAGWRLARQLGARVEELSEAGFIQQRGADLRRLTPPLALVARLHLHHDEPEPQRRRAYARLVRHLAARATTEAERLTLAHSRDESEREIAAAAHRWFLRHWHPLHRLVMAPDPTGKGHVAPPPRRARSAWFALARAIGGWYEQSGRDKRWRVLCRSVHVIAEASDMRQADGWARNSLGVVALRQGNWTEAVEEFTAAHRLRGHRGVSQALTNRGVARLHLGQTDEAIADLLDARRHRASGDRLGRGITDLNLGEALRRQGQLARARRYLVEAANALEDLDRGAYAAALTNVVLVYAELGDEQDAARAWREAFRVHDELADEPGGFEARLNAAIALLMCVPPRAEEATTLLDLILQRCGDRAPTPLLARARLYAGDAAELLGTPWRARYHWARAGDVARASGDTDTEAAARRRLAAVDVDTDVAQEF